MFCLQQIQFMTFMYIRKLINDCTIHSGKNVWFLPNLYYKFNH